MLSVDPPPGHCVVDVKECLKIPVQRTEEKRREQNKTEQNKTEQCVIERFKTSVEFA